jgi:hypothetical protein
MNSPPRWVLSKTTHNAHLDLGERSAKSLRVYSSHVIVTACRAHLDSEATVVPETYQPQCSNCQRLQRTRTTPKLVPDFLEMLRAGNARFAPSIREVLA